MPGLVIGGDSNYVGEGTVGGLGFSDIRADIVAALDSAQSEANGWDATVKAALLASLSSIVRTSDTVVTITLPAVASYDITAQETITATVPGISVKGGASITGSPTFTVDAVGGGFNPALSLISMQVSQPVRRQKAVIAY